MYCSLFLTTLLLSPNDGLKFGRNRWLIKLK